MDEHDEHAAFVIALDTIPRSIAIARRHVHAYLQHSNAPAAVVDDAVLITSELATNALRHEGTKMTVRLLQGSGHCRIEVADDGLTTRSGAPARQCAAVQDLGLAVVSALATLGQQLSAAGTTVSADLTWATPKALT